jgi:hypothetical protein
MTDQATTTTTDAQAARLHQARAELARRVIAAALSAGEGWCGDPDPHAAHVVATGRCDGVAEIPESELRAIFGDR